MAECLQHAAGAARFYQHCAIKYTNLHGGTYSPCKYFQNIIFSKFSKNNFLKFFGPFPGAPWALAPFSNSPSPATLPHIFFRRFDLFFHFLLHGTSFHILLGLVNIFFRSKVHVRLKLAAYYSPHIT